MKPKNQDESKAPALLIWEVAKTSPGENALKIGGVRAGLGGQVRMTKADADAMNEALPGCLKLVGI
jgi:hypothetical protein